MRPLSEYFTPGCLFVPALMALPTAALGEQSQVPPPTSGLAVNLDLGTLAGVLGVILTIVFFVVGYRQTIGAKKERVSAADRDVVETLLRRFTLEPDFSITLDEIERFVAGKAIDFHVKRLDVLSIDELWVLLYSRVVSTDYVSAKQRKPILEKINKSFEPKPGDDGLLLKSSLAEEALTKNTKKLQFASLGLISALMSGVLLALASSLVANYEKIATATKVPLIIGGALSLATATVLVLFFALRERQTATKETDFSVSRPRPYEFERGLIQRLKAIGVDIDMRQRAVDMIVTIKNRRVAVDMKTFPPALRLAKSMAKRMNSSLAQFECDVGYFVIASPIPAQIRELNSDKVRFVEVDEFFNSLTGPEHVVSLAKDGA